MSAPLLSDRDPGPCPPVGTQLHDVYGPSGTWTVAEPGKLSLNGSNTLHRWGAVYRVFGPLTVVTS